MSFSWYNSLYPFWTWCSGNPTCLSQISLNVHAILYCSFAISEISPRFHWTRTYITILDPLYHYSLLNPLVLMVWIPTFRDCYSQYIPIKCPWITVEYPILLGYTYSINKSQKRTTHYGYVPLNPILCPIDSSFNPIKTLISQSNHHIRSWNPTKSPWKSPFLSIWKLPKS